MSRFQLEFLLVLFLSGFVIAFLIGWLLTCRKPNFFRIALWAAFAGATSAGLLTVSLNALFFYMMGPKEVDHFSELLTVEQARQEDCPIPLPNAARNVQFVYASGGLQALEILVRFEAPVEVCRAHSATVFDAWVKHQQERNVQGKPMSPGGPFLARSLTPMTGPPKPENNDMVGRAKWFDVENIRNGSTTGPADEWEPQVWIDNDRGIFYYKLTD